MTCRNPIIATRTSPYPTAAGSDRRVKATGRANRERSPSPESPHDVLHPFPSTLDAANVPGAPRDQLRAAGPPRPGRRRLPDGDGIPALPGPNRQRPSDSNRMARDFRPRRRDGSSQDGLRDRRPGGPGSSVRIVAGSMEPPAGPSASRSEAPTRGRIGRCDRGTVRNDLRVDRESPRRTGGSERQRPGSDDGTRARCHRGAGDEAATTLDRSQARNPSRTCTVLDALTIASLGSGTSGPEMETGRTSFGSLPHSSHLLDDRLAAPKSRAVRIDLPTSPVSAGEPA